MDIGTAAVDGTCSSSGGSRRIRLGDLGTIFTPTKPGFRGIGMTFQLVLAAPIFVRRHIYADAGFLNEAAMVSLPSNPSEAVHEGTGSSSSVYATTAINRRFAPAAAVLALTAQIRRRPQAQSLHDTALSCFDQRYLDAGRPIVQAFVRGYHVGLATVKAEWQVASAKKPRR